MKIVAALLLVVLVTVSASYQKYKGDYKYQKYNKKCDDHCNSKVLYVCGNDNRNYINECALNKAICEDKYGKLAKRHDGLCETFFGSKLRGAVFNPVCANDDKTYSNVIFMDLAACLTRKWKQVKKEGTCSCVKYGGKYCNKDIPKCDIGCPAVYNPVCGDDGNSYVNECALEKQNCILGGKALTKLHNGICKENYKDIVGIEYFNPVCGNDKNTYSSKAFVDVARCQDFWLDIVKYKSCDAYGQYKY